MRRLFKISAIAIVVVMVVAIAGYAYLKWGLAPEIPEVKDKWALELKREKKGTDFYTIGNNWLRKNEFGLWEEYVEGEPFERGVITGKLNKELLYTQEQSFVDQIYKLVPGRTRLHFLSLFTRVFNRHLEENVTLEHKLEIYGESFSAPHEFDYIAPAYDRMLNYHAAHDLGHALQNFALVGCTSFGAWDSRTSDSSLLIGRNCDFSMGDKFAEDKIMYFCNPKQGHKFAFVTWAGMMGCLSGMNEKGLTVTINAAKSDVPTASATPIALLAREILQYAASIEEAHAIAKKRKTFVSETIMIGSAADHEVALIEKSPAHCALYRIDGDEILCTNHYQSDTFKQEQNNLENIRTSASQYRYERLTELLGRNLKLDYLNTASILRDTYGKGGKEIGLGNEKALNQFIAHHAVIFEPEKLRFWISTAPYQVGPFICYDLKKVFDLAPAYKGGTLYEAELTIPSDTLLRWKRYMEFKGLRQFVKGAIEGKEKVKDDAMLEANLIGLNPEFWETYYWLAEYFKAKNDKAKAVKYYQLALTKEINDLNEKEKVSEALKEVLQSD